MSRPIPDLKDARKRVPEWTKKQWASYGRAVKAARIGLGTMVLSVRTLAERLGLRYATLSYLEQGRPVYRRTLAVIERWLKMKAAGRQTRGSSK